jgi:branched-subunit amino acid aminotransferase/4-amino-4-deoxychorismate lyase
MIILDQKGHVSELLYSNIFWIKNDIFYTSSLETGCIKGVMRTYLIGKLEEEGLSLKEVNVAPEKLFQADHVFATNASGLRPLIKIANVRFKAYPDLEKFMI